MATNDYPLDLEAVEKGQQFSNEKLEEILGVKSSDLPKFRFAVMSLQQLIQERLGFTVKANEDGLFVLLDAEAFEHNKRLFYQNLRSAKNRVILSGEIDASMLTLDQRMRHTEHLVRASRIVQAVDREVIQIRTESRRAPLKPAAPELGGSLKQ